MDKDDKFYSLVLISVLACLSFAMVMVFVSYRLRLQAVQTCIDHTQKPLECIHMPG